MEKLVFQGKGGEIRLAVLDLALRPAWIFETLRLWRPYTSVPILLEQASDLTAQELHALRSRRRALNYIFRFYVAATGWGARRRTHAQNVWAAYCRGYQPHVLAPAFLTHLAAAVKMGQAAGPFFHHHSEPGAQFAAGDLRAFLAQTAPRRQFTDASLRAWLHTLVHFQMLTRGARVGEYVVRRPLPVAGGIFPLLVYSWAGARQVACVDPVAFAQDPILAYVDRAGFDHYWRLHAGHLWYAEEAVHPDGPQLRWRLRYPNPHDMERTLINLLTAYRRPRRYAWMDYMASTGFSNTPNPSISPRMWSPG